MFKCVNFIIGIKKLTSSIHTLIFLWTPKGFISPESFLILFLNLYIPPRLQKSFKFMVLKLLAHTFVSQKIESVNFYFCLQAKLFPNFPSLSPRQKEITHSSRTVFSDFPKQKGDGLGVLQVQNITKIKPTRLLVKSFDKFHNLCNF